MDTSQKYSCRLLKITTEQFAIFEDSYEAFDKKKDEQNLSLNIQTRFVGSIEHKVFGVFFLFKLNNKETNSTILLAETGLNFKLEDETWDHFFDKEKSLLTIPKDYASHLLGICIGTARGIVHSKTEGTKYNGLFIPLISSEKLLREDVEIKLDPNNKFEIIKGKIARKTKPTTKKNNLKKH